MRAKDLVKGNIAYHEELNPEVWDGRELRVDVRYKLLEIAQRFVEYLEVPNFKLVDVILRGSLVNYNYTQYSDFDLHIVTDFAAIDSDITEQFYLAKKRIWNDEHDITIKGHEVELYVEDKDAKNVSEGTYSVLDSKWLRTPNYNPPSIDDHAVNAKARDLMTQINRAIKTGSVEDITRLQDKIKAARQAGLNAGGEFSTENLAFKIVRNKGYLDKLYKNKNQKFDQELSLDEGLTLCEQGSWELHETRGNVEFRKSSMFDQSVAVKSKNSLGLVSKLSSFLDAKAVAPSQPWGSSDSAFISAGPLGTTIPKLRHAHLTRDVSVFYTVEGSDPAIVKLYGVFDHRESGTGTPANIKKQKSLAQQLGHQRI